MTRALLYYRRSNSELRFAIGLFAVATFCPTLSSYVFFFSSRRRHTRCYRDWSSDVCSSDLFYTNRHSLSRSFRGWSRPDLRDSMDYGLGSDEAASRLAVVLWGRRRPPAGRLRRRCALLRQGDQIGRASCRGRVEICVVRAAI